MLHIRGRCGWRSCSQQHNLHTTLPLMLFTLLALVTQVTAAPAPADACADVTVALGHLLPILDDHNATSFGAALTTATESAEGCGSLHVLVTGATLFAPAGEFDGDVLDYVSRCHPRPETHA